MYNCTFDIDVVVIYQHEGRSLDINNPWTSAVLWHTKYGRRGMALASFGVEYK